MGVPPVVPPRSSTALPCIPLHSHPGPAAAPLSPSGPPLLPGRVHTTHGTAATAVRAAARQVSQVQRCVPHRAVPGTWGSLRPRAAHGGPPPFRSAAATHPAPSAPPAHAAVLLAPQQGQQPPAASCHCQWRRPQQPPAGAHLWHHPENTAGPPVPRQLLTEVRASSSTSILSITDPRDCSRHPQTTGHDRRPLSMPRYFELLSFKPLKITTNRVARYARTVHDCTSHTIMVNMVRCSRPGRGTCG